VELGHQRDASGHLQNAPSNLKPPKTRRLKDFLIGHSILARNLHPFGHNPLKNPSGS
jgi:hypothetical protein